MNNLDSINSEIKEAQVKLRNLRKLKEELLQQELKNKYYKSYSNYYKIKSTARGIAEYDVIKIEFGKNTQLIKISSSTAISFFTDSNHLITIDEETYNKVEKTLNQCIKLMGNVVANN